jgi:hypothetical protein
MRRITLRRLGSIIAIIMIAGFLAACTTSYSNDGSSGTKTKQQNNDGGGY